MHPWGFPCESKSYRKAEKSSGKRSVLSTKECLITQPATDAMIEQRFGPGLPPINEIVKNTSLMLINQYYALTGPRPYAPNVVEVGGLQVGPQKPLPKVSLCYIF